MARRGRHLTEMQKTILRSANLRDMALLRQTPGAMEVLSGVRVELLLPELFDGVSRSGNYTYTAIGRAEGIEIDLNYTLRVEGGVSRLGGVVCARVIKGNQSFEYIIERIGTRTTITPDN
jgi:hypothetical protein